MASPRASQVTRDVARKRLMPMALALFFTIELQLVPEQVGSFVDPLLELVPEQVAQLSPGTVTGSAASSSRTLGPPMKAPLQATGNFGDLRDGRFHAGIDYSTFGKVGRPVYAVDDGWVWRVRASGLCTASSTPPGASRTA